MKDAIEALVGVIEFLIQGALAASVIIYLLAFFHPAISSLRLYVKEHWKVASGQEDRADRRHPLLAALAIAGLYFLGIVTNVVDYWLLTPVHHQVIERSHEIAALGCGSRTTAGASTRSGYAFVGTTFRSLVLRDGYNYSEYNEYVRSDAAWRSKALGAHQSALPGLRKMIRIVRGVVFASFLVVIVGALKVGVTITFVAISSASGLLPFLRRMASIVYRYFISYDEYQCPQSWDRRKAISVALRRVVAPNFQLVLLATGVFAVSSLGYRTVETEYHLLVRFGDHEAVCECPGGTDDSESGSRGLLAPGPHTTQRAGPHWAVHDEGARESLKHSRELSSTDRGRK